MEHKEKKYCSIRQRYKGHWQGRQRSSSTSGNLHVSEGSTPKPSGSKRTSSTNSGFLGDEVHKPPCFRRSYPKTFGFQANQFNKLQEICDYAPRGHAPERQISLITAMRIQDQEFLLSSGATDHLQQISTDTSDLHQPNLRFLPSIDMQGQDSESP
ncbi:hypothetical protein DY000_02021835 [Brassica cretica]|uniref:Uncharacterized protein n=1 Tax=Brassica cretica TaxID=69181 RepID=A0ABQ7DZN9_BRACR|nr:hypothetical protein DY000_02021835 [Brassica cretica]